MSHQAKWERGILHGETSGFVAVRPFCPVISMFYYLDTRSEQRPAEDAQLAPSQQRSEYSIAHEWDHSSPP